MKPQVCILTLTIFSISCKKNKVDAGEIIEIYLLKNYSTVTGKCQIDPSNSAIQNTATINNQDILEYSQTNYQYKLTNAAIRKVQAFKDFTPFAVAVDKQVIYYGFFKPSFSSSSCDNSITMDLDWTTGNKIFLKLGYSGQLQGVVIDDQRNNPKLISTLKNQGKLK